MVQISDYMIKMLKDDDNYIYLAKTLDDIICGEPNTHNATIKKILIEYQFVPNQIEDDYNKCKQYIINRLFATCALSELCKTLCSNSFKIGNWQIKFTDFNASKLSHSYPSVNFLLEHSDGRKSASNIFFRYNDDNLIDQNTQFTQQLINITIFKYRDNYECNLQLHELNIQKVLTIIADAMNLN